MCGIIAISSSKDRNFRLDKALFKIKHRGPDDQGVFVSKFRDCHLGHVRLSILDLSVSGRQPMMDSSRRFIICYNGEVYNYKELRAYLNKRYGLIHWKSRTDSEVIVEGVARDGISFLSRLNGIFALAIYDLHERLLHVLRDPIGIKPLFITEQDGVYFSSELKGLLGLPNLKRTLCTQSFGDQLAFMYVPEPNTLYNQFYKVIPGVCFTYKDGKLFGEQPLFAHLNRPLSLTTEEEAVESLRYAFDMAISRQLRADVPVSLFLSGGLDSSAVAHQTVLSGANIDSAYTIAFSPEDQTRDMQSDDLYYARIMADKLGLNLEVVQVQANCLSLLPELIYFMEDGFTDPSAINTYLISQKARQAGVKVLLSGQGADEFLGGYRRYLAERLLASMPSLVRFAISLLGNMPSISGRFNAVSRRIARFATLASQTSSMRLLGMYTWTSPSVIDHLLVSDSLWKGGIVFEELFDTYSNDDIVAAMMEVDHQYDLMSLNLTYTDRMSMAVGVEARVPFLDFDLIRVMNSIPVNLKLKGRQGKYVFKKAMEPRLPKEIIYRDKAGFGLPLRAWLRQNNEMLDQYLDTSRLMKQGLFDAIVIEHLLSEQKEGKSDHTNTLFTLLCQQLWLEVNLTGDEYYIH